MLNKNDFKKAIGQPDKPFENSVQRTLNTILAEESRNRGKSRRLVRYIFAAAACVAAAACALFFLGLPGGQPDTVYTPDGISNPSAAYTPGVMSQPEDEESEPPETIYGDEQPEDTQTDAESSTEVIPESRESHEATPAPIQQFTDAGAEQPEPEQPEQTANALQPTPAPRPMNMPEDHLLFEQVFNITVNDLYPGYTYSDTILDKSDNKHWSVSNGQESRIACSICYGEIIEADIDEGGFKALTLNVYLGYCDTEHIEAIMAISVPWLSELYSTAIVETAQISTDLGLHTIEITFDRNGDPKFCEMYFGDNNEVYISWVREEETGKFSIIKLYTAPEYVPLDYDDPADYDTMEVIIPDPVLEAAIRKELNWQGKLTPAKLAELTILQITDTPIESLEGLQYCTNLDCLELGGCGIDDEDMKYIGSLPSLFTLNLGNNNITDITELSGLDLGWLYLCENNISDLWPLSGMMHLYELHLSGNSLSGEGTLKPLEGLVGMQLLYLNDCGITDVAPLAELYKNAPLLDTILLDRNPVEDYDPIRDLDIRNIHWGN